MKKIIVGMSGGVDSSVTACLLKEQGFEVEGVSFILYETRLKNTFSGCCSIGSVNDAAKTAEHLGVRHSTVDLRDEFMSKVIEPFIELYSRGVTPNPCILCNKHIKFPYLLKLADERNAGHISTGHYARVTRAEGKDFSNVTSGLPTFRSPLLMKGLDPRKDQSYVLYVLNRECLGRLVLPLGEKKKTEVRSIAAGLGLPAAERPESQEICFIEDRKYFRLLEGLSGGSEGPVIDVETGNVLARHNGIHIFTPGQRKRLGVATGKPLYVVKIDPSEHAVYVGPKERAMMREFEVEDVNWLVSSSEISDIKRLTSDPPGFRASVKVRSTMKDEPAVIEVIDRSSVKVLFDAPQWAPAPGQSAVFYSDDIVIGGGVIK